MAKRNVPKPKTNAVSNALPRIKQSVLQTLVEPITTEAVKRAGKGASEADVVSNAQKLLGEIMEQMFPGRTVQTQSLDDKLNEKEKQLIERALRNSSSNLERAAKFLGVTSRSLYYRMENLFIDLSSIKGKPKPDQPRIDLNGELAKLEKRLIDEAIKKTGNIKLAAHQLGITQKSLRHRMEKHESAQ